MDSKQLMAENIIRCQEILKDNETQLEKYSKMVEENQKRQEEHIANMNDIIRFYKKHIEFMKRKLKD